MPIAGKPMIGHVLHRLSRSERIDEIVLATSDAPGNDVLIEYVRRLGHESFVGDEKDVLDRYYRSAKYFDADAVVRITGDCPLIDPKVVDETINLYEQSGVDYASNTIERSYPDGLDVEVFSFNALERAWKDSIQPRQREHVTPYIYESGRFRLASQVNDTDHSDERWTVDEAADLEFVKKVFGIFHPVTDFSWKEAIRVIEENRNDFPIRYIKQNEGMRMGTGQKLWKRAKNVIPGGNMLISKRAEQFLPFHWPAYYSRAQGCRLWDLDDNEFIDMSIMGIGTNILGYGNLEVDEAVRVAVAAGNMSTFNCPEEVYLAERLVDIHPWADMVKLARTGGEANSMAIRIARAASGREKVAICGYHGWHDWYLAANIGETSNLDGHLMPGLEPIGVPRHLRGSVLPFTYNNISELEAILENDDVGVIKMEVSRNMEPAPGFLQRVRELATEKDIVLVFDECTSGFRSSFGGLHKVYGVDPDMAIFAKALGNGYAISAVVGSREVMNAAQSTFISSTFWTERIGPTAALKTLEVMERTRSWEKITSTGLEISRRWKQLAEKHKLEISITGLPALTGFTIASDDWLKYKTLITQEMLKKGFLAANSVYVCTEHSPDIVDEYFEHLDPVFETISECEEGKSIDALLEGPICHSGFKRLN